MKNDFAKHVTGFFSNYLSAERGVSPNTMRSYGASFASFLDFMKEKKGTTAERLTLDHMNRKNVLEFLDWIQSGGCSVSTRNQRLAALHAFCKYMQYEDVGRLQQWQEVMSIKIKKTIKGTMNYLTLDGMKHLLVVAVTNPPKYSFNRCKSATCKFLFRDTKSARDKNGTKPRKNKVKNTSPEISLVEYLSFVCKGTNLSLEKRGEIPISLIHNSFSYHCTLNVVIANGFDLKRHNLRKSGVNFCFALCWTFSKTRTGNRTKDLPPLLSNPWFCECLNDRHLKMLNFK